MPPDDSLATPASTVTAEPAKPPAPAAAGHQKTSYRKLPGRPPVLRLAATGRRHLYLGDDHLLQVETMYFTENYRRFAYADIRSFLLRQTPRGLIYNVILAVGLAAFAGLAFFSRSEPVGLWIFGVLGALFALALLVNLARGATCHCQLQTAVDSHKLPSLSRVRPAQKALRLLEERIAAVQGALAPSDAAARVDQLLASRPQNYQGPGSGPTPYNY